MVCNVCQSSSIELYLKGIFDDDDVNVYECKDCELQFLNPIMSALEEDNYYRNYYKTQESRYIEKTSLEDIQTQSYLYHKEYINNYKNYLNAENLSVLEIGSGTGGFIELLHKDFNITNITVVEKSDSNIKYLKSKYNELAVYSDLNEIENKFDVIIAIALFEHLREPKEFLKKKPLCKNKS